MTSRSLYTLFASTSVLFLCSALFLAACEGPVGPEGPPGPQGAAGAAGATGATGEQGPPGNANVQSLTVSLRASDFRQESQNLEVAAYQASMVTREVHERGVILAYTDLGSNGQVFYPLPIYFNSGQVELSFASALGSALVTILRPSGTQPLASQFSGHRVRFVAIAPSAAPMLEDVDLSDYKAVMNALAGTH